MFYRVKNYPLIKVCRSKLPYAYVTVLKEKSMHEYTNFSSSYVYSHIPGFPRPMQSPLFLTGANFGLRVQISLYVIHSTNTLFSRRSHNCSVYMYVRCKYVAIADIQL